MNKIGASCRTTYTAYHKSGSRPVKDIIWIVLHSTEGGTSAGNIARYFQSPKSGGSAHLVIDDNACYRCLRNTDIPWGAPGANEQGFHIEQVAYAAWTQKQWLAHEHMLERVAFKMAYHAHLFSIPLRFVDAAGLKRGVKGVTTHAEVSKAFPNNVGNHHDPGTGYPMGYVLALAKKYLAEIKAC